MRLIGWHVDGTLPDLPKFVIIGAPHTSNWDFVLFLGVMFYSAGKRALYGKGGDFPLPDWLVLSLLRRLSR